jgi:hypothetical protein
VQLREPVGEIYVGYGLFAVLSDGRELEAENIRVEGAGFDKRLQEFARFGLREGEENALEGVDDFEEELAWKDAPWTLG